MVHLVNLYVFNCTIGLHRLPLGFLPVIFLIRLFHQSVVIHFLHVYLRPVYDLPSHYLLLLPVQETCSHLFNCNYSFVILSSLMHTFIALPIKFVYFCNSLFCNTCTLNSSMHPPLYCSSNSSHSLSCSY